jgi:hypothetical protein
MRGLKERAAGAIPGREMRSITDITSTALGKEEMVVYLGSNVAHRSLAKWRLWKQHLLLGNACNIHARNNRRTVFSVVCTAAVSGQQLSKNIPAATNTKATT